MSSEMTKEAQRFRLTRLDLSPSSMKFGFFGKLDKEARLPKVKDFPLNMMMVGQSFYMKKGEHWPVRFVEVRERVNRCNKSGAAVFKCIWNKNRTILEVARIG